MSNAKMKSGNSLMQSDQVMPSFAVKEQYILDYFEVVDINRRIMKMLVKGYTKKDIVKTRTYRDFVSRLVSSGEKVRRKIEKRKTKEYDILLLFMSEFYEKGSMDFDLSIKAMKQLGNFLEDSGFTKLEVVQVKPDAAVTEW